jgi:rare lipoprotein A
MEAIMDYMRSSLFLRCLAYVALTAALPLAPSETHAGEHGAKSAKVKAKTTATGLASFYARHLDGKQTARGDSFDNDELVAAHRSYPFGTRVRVTNLENHTSVVVRIVDRGASKANRREGVIIDLSQAAAARLKMKKDGRARVRLQVLEWGDGEGKR